MELGDRIKELRAKLRLTQEDFSKRLGMKRNSIAQIEGGRSTSEQTVRMICREFNVSETWLRTGKGEMFIKKSRDSEIDAFISRALQGKPDNFKLRLVSALSRLGENEWEVLERLAVALARGSEASAEILPQFSTSSIEAETRAEAEETYKQILQEKRLEVEFSASQSDTGTTGEEAV